MRRRLLAALLAAVAALMLTGTVAAHPLGNFSVNQFSRLTVAGDALQVRYVVDMAEIPAFQERPSLDANGDGHVSDAEAEAYLARRAPELAAGLLLEVDGASAPLREVSRAIAFPAGQGGLTTLRITLDLEASLGAAATHTVHYRVANYDERLGWREIVAGADGMALRGEGLPTEDRSAELTAYPDDLLSSPLDVRSVQFTVAPGEAGAIAPHRVALVTPAADALRGLVDARELTPAAMLGALLLAFGLGAGHALTPGHGKTIVAAYLVGSRGTALHAVVLGLVTTLTHTAGVFALGFATLLLSRYVLPERIYPWLELVSGALVVLLGVGLLRTRLAALLTGRSAHSHGHAHTHPHSHDHGHGHDHGPGGHSHEHDAALADELAGAIRRRAPGTSWRGLLALGMSGGLLPCPSALVVLLGAVAVGRVGFGMLLIVAFSMGLAAVLTGIGLLLVLARDLFERVPTGGPLLRALPVGGAAIVVLVGVGITAGAIGHL